MNFLYIIIASLFLVSGSCWSQNSEVSDASNEKLLKWEKTVDYVNAEIILLYMEEFKVKNKLNYQEKESYDKFKSAHANTKIDNPINFNKLTSHLDLAWASTFKGIASPINELKSLDDKSPTILFQKVDSLLKARSSEISLGNSFGQLKEKIIGVNKKTDVSEGQQKMSVVNSSQVSNITPTDNLNQNISSSSLVYYLLIPLFLFILSTVLFALKFKKTKKASSKLNHENERLKGFIRQGDVKNSQNDRTIANLKNDITTLKKTLQSMSYQSIKAEQIIDKDPMEGNFPVEKTKILYAGKPSVNKVFTETFDQPQERQTIFKLTVDLNNGENAIFEVSDVSDFMIKNITNIPDDYLYRVCNHENSNSEFKREIITTKKGKAELIDGNWAVREENKATIKFQ